MGLSVTMLGAAQTVTGSKFLLEYHGKKVLIDCGLFQGLKELRNLNREKLPVDLSTLEGVFITHSHLDHVGYLPLLVNSGFKKKIYCTAPTRDLTEIMLLDAARIQEEEAELANAEGFSKHNPARPLYTTSDVHKVLKLFEVISLDKPIEIAKGFKFTYIPNGHILGSCAILVQTGKEKVLFSGDLGRSKPLLVIPGQYPLGCDYLFIESTYGDRRHDPTPPIRTLEFAINDSLERGGDLIIPSFAVGRSQELLYLIHQLKKQHRIPDVPVYFDTPMGIQATAVYLNHPAWHRLSKKELTAVIATAVQVSTMQESQRVLKNKKRKIIIAGSGMITGGRVLNHLKKGITEEKNTVLLVGYQAQGTRGRQLQEGASEIKIHGEYYKVKARILQMTNLSAHADQREMIEWISHMKVKPREIFLIHGEPQAQDCFRVKLQDKFNVRVEIPRLWERVDLS